MRGQGRVFRPTNGRGYKARVWLADYSVGGTRKRESTHCTSKKDALEWLRQRIGDRRSGKITGHPERVTLKQLRELVERQYTLDGRKSVARVKEAFGHLEAFFTADERAMQITRARVDAYAEHRLAGDAANKVKPVARATVNNELAQLRRGFKLAIEAGLLAVMPCFKLPKPQNARSGFFEDGEFAALLLELPADARRDLVQFLRATGWRREEGRLLQWAAVDRDGGTIRLEEARSKSGKPRVFPFGLAPSLKTLLDTRWEARDGLYVFHLNGQPIGVQALRYAWARATKRAGVPGRLIHDLRRSAARDFRRAGVSEGEIMKLCGWETRSMFDRYNVIDEADLARAVSKRFANGTPSARPDAPANDSASLTSSAS